MLVEPRARRPTALAAAMLSTGSSATTFVRHAGPEDRAVGGRHRLDPVLPRALPNRSSTRQRHWVQHVDFGLAKTMASNTGTACLDETGTCTDLDTSSTCVGEVPRPRVRLLHRGRRRACGCIDLIGEDNVMIETDYPHSDSTWPDSIDVVQKMIAPLSPRDAAQAAARERRAAVPVHSRRRADPPGQELIRQCILRPPTTRSRCHPSGSPPRSRPPTPAPRSRTSLPWANSRRWRPRSPCSSSTRPRRRARRQVCS